MLLDIETAVFRNVDPNKTIIEAIKAGEIEMDSEMMEPETLEELRDEYGVTHIEDVNNGRMSIEDAIENCELE